MQTIKVNLDFYNNTLTTINAKQHDTFARCINVTCTDQGKKVYLNATEMSVYVALHKSNSDDEFEHADILEDGTINIQLTENMLSTSGRCYFDAIVFNKGGLTVDDIRLVFSMEDLNTYVLSTMPICLNVIENAVSYAKLEQHKNYNGLLYAIALAENMEVYTVEQEESRQLAENARVEAEIQREQTFNSAVNECNIATQNAITATNNANTVSEQIRSDADVAIEECNTAITSTNEATQNAITATNNANTVSEQIRSDADTAILDCNEATDRANIAAEKCESIVDGSGLILQEEKASANGVATLDENGQIPISQLGNVHQILYGTTEPTDDIGNDGDIYMMIIE